MDNFTKEVNGYTDLINNELRTYLSKSPEWDCNIDLFDAMEYAMFPGGKRIRPLLLLGACDSVGGAGERALPFACALEMIHTYSLIHDDLPAMDDDDTRRGKPSCHVRFGEATAILAGDGLLNLAFEVMSRACMENPEEPALRAMNAIASASGICGMVGGQAADMYYENKKASPDALAFIHTNKTAALFGAALEAGALLGGSGHKSREFASAGRILGLAFQIKDDLLDLESGDGSDAQKNTYPSVFGIDRAKEDYARYSGGARLALRGLSLEDTFLAALFEYITDRQS